MELSWISRERRIYATTPAKEEIYREKRQIKQAKNDPEQKDANAKRAYILEAMARAKARKNN